MPLIVLTADRPPELRDVGAGQAIDQIKLYGSFVKWFVEVGNHEPGRDERHAPPRARPAARTRRRSGGRPGPVHLNFPLREPLAPVPTRGWRPPTGRAATTARRGCACTSPTRCPTRTVESTGRRDGGDAARRDRLRRRRGEPVADAVARAGARRRAGRCWPSPRRACAAAPHDRSRVVAHYDVLLRGGGWAARTRPTWCCASATRRRRSRCAPGWRRRAAGRDRPARAPGMSRRARADTIVHAAPRALAMLWRRCSSATPARRDRAGSTRGARPTRSCPRRSADGTEPFEPTVYTALAGGCPTARCVWVARRCRSATSRRSSPRIGADPLPGEPRRQRDRRRRCRRRSGAALAPARPRCLLIGELALIHDLGGLVAAARAGHRADDRLRQQRRRRHLRLPAGGRARRPRPCTSQHIADAERADLAKVAALAGLRHVVASYG